MRLQLKNIFVVINKGFEIINLVVYALLAIASMSNVDLKEFKAKKLSLPINIFLFFLLGFLLIVMTYGAYRRQAD